MDASRPLHLGDALRPSAASTAAARVADAAVDSAIPRHSLNKTALRMYKLSRDRSVREPSHKVNVNESTWVNE